MALKRTISKRRLRVFYGEIMINRMLSLVGLRDYSWGQSIAIAFGRYMMESGHSFLIRETLGLGFLEILS